VARASHRMASLEAILPAGYRTNNRLPLVRILQVYVYRVGALFGRSRKMQGTRST